MRSNDPIAAKYLREVIGAKEMLNSTKRYCLWLVEASASDIKSSPELSARVSGVRSYRNASKRAATQKLALRPAEFGEIRQPTTNYIAVPAVSSENREYVPIAVYPQEVVATNALLVIPDNSLETFSIVQSKPFMAWTRAVSGRLESRLRISATITYNNFPFPSTSDADNRLLRECALAVFAARDANEGESLADLYDSDAMPAGLRLAHAKLDAQVLRMYGLKSNATDAEILEVLFAKYAELTQASKS
jgi:hypothetical protein